jgi:16S rRNA (guanine527-N7)-methyltransferase
MTTESALSRLAQLRSQYGLCPRQHDQLVRLLAALESTAHAPTSVRRAESAIDVHVADSLVALEFETVREAATITDIGSGAGFPGLVLAMALPEGEVWLVESQSRKCAFINEIAALMDLENARVVCTRVEEWRRGVKGHDLVVARALAPQPVVLEYAAPLLRIGGALVDWRGRRKPDEEDAADRAASSLGMRSAEVRKVIPFDGATDRHLHMFVKTEETPPRFPRRSGIARKRPLGA